MVMQHHSTSFWMNAKQGLGGCAAKTICIDRQHFNLGSHIVSIAYCPFF